MQPLGPGFRVADRRTEIRAVPDMPGRLHVRVEDYLENVGDRPIRSLDARLPDESAFGSENLRITINGNEVSPERTSDTDGGLIRVPFDPAWEQRQSREVVTELDATSDSSGQGIIASSAAAFYIADETALPLWQPPRGIFGKSNLNPARESLTVFTPPDFRAIASGKPLRQRVAGNLVAHGFSIDSIKDFLPFVVAGRYQEQVTHAMKDSVSFWTFEALDAGQAQIAGMRIASSMRAFTDFFGPASPGKTAIHIVEAPVQLSGEFGVPGDPGGASFPGGVLLDQRAFTQGIAREAVLELAEYELVRTWFGWRVRPRPEAQILMGRGMGLFGLVVAAEARGPDERRRIATLLLARYNESRQAAADRPLLEPPTGYSREEHISTGYKAALFLVALEDLCGRDNLRTAIKHILRAEGGGEVAVEELRAAVEDASRRNLAEMFRAWLNQPGVPENFRARYAGSPNAQDRN